jgi:glutamate N-acetyltransferase / amino-acid N-acetyltransferase
LLIAPHVTPPRAPQARLRVRAEVSVGTESFKIPAAPDLIPDGPWKKVEGGVCAAKGFKATGARGGRAAVATRREEGRG